MQALGRPIARRYGCCFSLTSTTITPGVMFAVAGYYTETTVVDGSGPVVSFFHHRRLFTGGAWSFSWTARTFEHRIAPRKSGLPLRGVVGSVQLCGRLRPRNRFHCGRQVMALAAPLRTCGLGFDLRRDGHGNHVRVGLVGRHHQHQHQIPRLFVEPEERLGGVDLSANFFTWLSMSGRGGEQENIRTLVLRLCISTSRSVDIGLDVQPDSVSVVKNVTGGRKTIPWSSKFIGRLQLLTGVIALTPVAVAVVERSSRRRGPCRPFPPRSRCP